MKELWTVQIEQNGGEYHGWVDIEAENVEQVDDRTIIADGVRMTFDENIEIV